MVSKYAQNFEQYEAATQTMQFSGSALNFMSLSKQNPKMYVQVLTEKLLPVPMHNFVPCANGKKASFVCRKFVNEPCPVCDNHIRDSYGNEIGQKKTYIGIAAQYDNEGPRKYTLVRNDVSLSNEKAQEILAKWPDLTHFPDGDNNTKFVDMPKVGLFIGNKTIDEGMAVAIAEFGSINDILFRVSREGTGLDTKYTVMNLGDSPYPSDSDILAPAIAMHMTVDEYIDAYIDEARYNRLLGIGATNASSNMQESAEQEPATQDEVKQETHASEAKQTISDEEIEAFIRAKYNGGKADA